MSQVSIDRAKLQRLLDAVAVVAPYPMREVNEPNRKPGSKPSKVVMDVRDTPERVELRDAAYAVAQELRAAA